MHKESNCNIIFLCVVHAFDHPDGAVLQEDQRALQKLLSKVKTQSDVKDRTAAAGVQAAEMVALNGIVGKYQVSQADLEVRWRSAIRTEHNRCDCLPSGC